MKDELFPAKLIEYLKISGFYGVLQCYYDKVDNHLVTSLVECWRPETHTFHFPFGETTITLEDVQMLWGLPLSDRVVSGSDFKWDNQQKIDNCENFLGITGLEGQDLSTNTIRFTTILQEIKASWPAPNASNEECLKIARCIIMHLIGAVVLPDHSGSAIYYFHLQNLIDLRECGKLSWGSAALACLYRNLCKAAEPSNWELAGPAMLLQMWAWERIPRIAPRIREGFDFSTPFGGRWRGSLSWAGVIRSSLTDFRSHIQCLNTDEFTWRPYEHVAHLINPMYTRGRACWNCDTYLVVFEVVEPHLPSRVMRQFGFFQTVPNNLLITRDEHTTLHGLSRKATTINWNQECAMYIAHWINRMAHVVTGQECGGEYRASPMYMNWFLERTAFYVEDPARQTGNTTRDVNIGGRFELLTQGIGDMHRMASQDNPFGLDNQLGGVQQMAQHYLNLTGAQHNLDYQTSHLASQWNPFEFPPHPPYNVDRPVTRADQRNTDTYFRFREPYTGNVPNYSYNETGESSSSMNEASSSTNQEFMSHHSGSMNETSLQFTPWQNSDFSHSTVGGDGFGESSNQGASSHLSPMEFSPMINQEHQEYYTPQQEEQTQTQQDFSGSFFSSLFDVDNFNQQYYNRPPQTRGNISPIPYGGNFSSTPEVQQEDQDEQLGRGRRNRNPTRCPISGGPLYRPHGHNH
ncbi:hypothetical protein SSX86_028245 [Deinandra increscens subsp. villosa]|uniref:Aminotransferase-like plant mobile domain-containing protein n=1 Tax=Deinandra increscens subsp. villosa TaxID=3103831 RepID=A0AAP0CAF6_9ASTR